MFADRVVKNIFAIGSSICATSFVFSTATSRMSESKMSKISYEPLKEPENIETLEDVEDLEHFKGCRFVFYNGQEGAKFKQSELKYARAFSKENDGSVVRLVEDKKAKCVQGSFVYIAVAPKPAEEATTQVPTT